jgi:hypothetical protein
MSEPTQNRVIGTQEAINALERSPETLALNFFELTPVNKVIFTITPSPWDLRLSKISYNFGSLDLSANGYIQLIISKVLNPNIYGTLELNSNILFSKMGGANRFVEGDSDFPENCVLGKNEAAYVYLISNVPTAVNLGVIGRLAIYYAPLMR